MNDKSIEISTNLTIDDLKRIGFRQIRTKLIVAGGILFFFIVFLLLGIAVNLLSRKNNLPLSVYLPILIPIGIFSLTLFFFVSAVNKQAGQLGENIEPTNYIFNEQGIEAESASTTVKTLWSKFLKAEENKTDFLIFTQKNIAIPFPKRFFTTDDQLSEFRNLLAEKLGKRN